MFGMKFKKKKDKINKVADKYLKIKILKPVAGKFGLSYSVGQTVKMDPKQADEIIKQEYGKIVK